MVLHDENQLSMYDYPLWLHGYAALATLRAARPALRSILDAPSTLEGVVAATQANPGHLQIALRTLTALQWVSKDSTGVYRTTEEVVACAQPAAIDALFEDVFGTAGELLPRLARWLPSVADGWSDFAVDVTKVPMLREMLTGAVVAPLLLELRSRSSLEGKIHLAGPLSTVWTVSGFFAQQGLATFNSKTRCLSLTTAGKFMVDRSAAFGVGLSYRPMFYRLDEALFGSPGEVFAHDEEGNELHVDRVLNVVGSGFMHKRYFQDMMTVHVQKIFNIEPVSSQPRAVVDMGCGDGTLLSTIFDYVKNHTLRGKHLSTHPLTMVGVDFSHASLKQTAATLSAAGVPHHTLWGDIGDPASMQAQIESRFGVTKDEVLHVRSFLDHDRPYIPPQTPPSAALAATLNAFSDGAYTQPSGAVVAPSDVFCSLVEHLQRWREVLGKFGLLVLEVSLLPVESTTKYMREATSLHFDCCQAHSGQLLMPATHFSLGAATAGLEPTPEVLMYPKKSPFTRVVLQNLRPDDVSIRLATMDDLPELYKLEAHWGAEELQVTYDVLKKRLDQHPFGQIVAVKDGAIVGAMYSQRVPSARLLHTAKRATELELHVPGAPVVQLLGVVVEADSGVGYKLRNHMVLMARLDSSVERACGITRCRSRQPDDTRDYQTYVDETHLTDKGLLFHAAVGAAIGPLVPDYRPADKINFGYGVLVTYEFREDAAESDADEESNCTMVETEASCIKLVCDTLDSLRYAGQAEGPVDWDTGRKQQGFMQLGLDSLDVVQLVAKLNEKIPIVLSHTVVFEKPNASELGRFIFHECEKLKTGEESGAADGPDDDLGIEADPAVFGGEVVQIPAKSFDDFLAGLKRDAAGNVDIEDLKRPPHGDRSEEGLKWSPTLGYHKDTDEEYWEGKALSYIKLKQIQAVCNAFDVEVDVETMQNWTVAQAKAYFLAGGKA